MQSASRTPEQRQAGLITARILLEIGAVMFRPEQPYKLTSGWHSPVYVDMRKVISFPRARRKIIEMAANCIMQNVGYESLDAVAGGETAGIPYAAWISEALMTPMLYVRKKPKGFGRDAQIEGDLREGSRVLLVEDLASDAASKVNFVNALRTAGAVVDHAFVLFFYGVFPTALKTLSELEIDLHFLANWWDVFDEAERGNYFDKKALDEVRNFLHDPLSWSKLHGGRDA